MGCILGKVGSEDMMFRVLDDCNDFYNLGDYNFEEAINYNPSTLIEDTELYVLEHFSSLEYCPDFLVGDLDPLNYNRLGVSNYEKLSYICVIQGGYFFFQKIRKSNFFVRKKFLSLTGEPSIQRIERSIMINELPDAIYNRDTNSLYFYKFSRVSSIFSGMSELYREATETETEEFLGQEFFDISGTFNFSKVNISNRKRISLVKDLFQSLSDQDKIAMYTYIGTYLDNTICNNGRFVVNDNNDLKNILWGLQQRFYTTPIGNNKRIANSIIEM